MRINQVLALLALSILGVQNSAFAVQPTLILKNQFGEQSNNSVIGGTFTGGSAAANSVMSNLTASVAAPVANTYSAVGAKLPANQLLTGFSAAAAPVAGTDTTLQAIQKLAGDLQNKAILTFTSAAGAGGAATAAMTVTGLHASDTILAVSQSVKGANSLPLLGFNTVALNALTAVWSGDPGAGSVIVVTVLR